MKYGNARESEDESALQEKSCICQHCLGIRRQQIESEKRWVNQNLLFDR